MENLLEAWKEFLSGKKSRQDVQEFQRHLMSNILLLHRELKDKTYKHSSYEVFNISDPKPRIIHKAKVRDRLLHHAIYRVLYPFFERTFITDSFSCRINKGTHKALERFKTFARKESRNHTKTVWVLSMAVAMPRSLIQVRWEAHTCSGGEISAWYCLSLSRSLLQ